jgi:transposase-like protein
MGVALEKPRNGLAYTQEQQLAGLELAATIGIYAAARELQVSPTTLYRWQRNHPKELSDMRAGEKEAFKHGFAQRLEDLADKYTEAEDQALEKVIEKIEAGNLDAKELAALIKAMGSSRGVATVGARATRGEDQQNSTLNINFPNLEAAMERLLGGPAPAAIEATATEE